MLLSGNLLQQMVWSGDTNGTPRVNRLLTHIERNWDELRQAEVGTAEHALAGVIEPVWYLAGDDYADFEGTYDMRVCHAEGASTVIIASEPLTKDTSHWQRVGFQHVVVFQRHGEHCGVQVQRLDI